MRSLPCCSSKTQYDTYGTTRAYREQQRPQRGKAAYGSSKCLVVEAGAEGRIDAAQRPALQCQLSQCATTPACGVISFVQFTGSWDGHRLRPLHTTKAPTEMQRLTAPLTTYRRAEFCIQLLVTLA